MREIDLLGATHWHLLMAKEVLMRKLVDWLIGGNLDRLLKALGGEE